MMTNEPIVLRPLGGPSSEVATNRGVSAVGAFASYGRTRFDRGELNRILNIYGRMVAAGEWRDYAIDFHDEVAIFSVFRRTSEMPLYRIEKRPKLKNRQGQYSVVAPGGQILERGHDLAAVLRILERKLMKVLKDSD